MEENRPIVYPFMRLLYSRKVLVALADFSVVIMGEFGLPENIVNSFHAFAIVIILSWTVKDVSSNLANGRNNK